MTERAKAEVEAFYRVLKARGLIKDETPYPPQVEAYEWERYLERKKKRRLDV